MADTVAELPKGQSINMICAEQQWEQTAVGVSNDTGADQKGKKCMCQPEAYQ